MPNITATNAFHRLKAHQLTLATRPYNARGILVKRCASCQINPQHCICDQQPALPSTIDFVLLYHRDEIFKPTNTGRLIADTFPENTYAFCWNRTQPQPELLALLSDPNRQCVIIFPADGLQEREILTAESRNNHKKLTLILLDGTWRQGRRMFNSSEWLADCAVLKLDPQARSLYATRKAACENYLSTAESAALALATCGEVSDAESLFNYFVLFNERYALMRGHR